MYKRCRECLEFIVITSMSTRWFHAKYGDDRTFESLKFPHKLPLEEYEAKE